MALKMSPSGAHIWIGGMYLLEVNALRIGPFTAQGARTMLWNLQDLNPGRLIGSLINDWAALRATIAGRYKHTHLSIRVHFLCSHRD